MYISNIHELKKLDYYKQLSFAYLTCKRLYPNYAYFSINYEFGNKNALKEAIDFIYDNLFNDISPEISHIETYLKNIDSNTPIPGDFKTIFASSALDACTTILETLDFMVDKQLSRLDDISTFSGDTVYMYIQFIENLDYNTDKLFDQKIFTHPLMQKEISIQEGIITYLSKITFIEISDVENLLALQGNDGKSNINITL